MTRASFYRRRVHELRRIALEDPEVMLREVGDHWRLTRGSVRVEYWPETGTAGCHETNQWPRHLGPQEVYEWLLKLDSPYRDA